MIRTVFLRGVSLRKPAEDCRFLLICCLDGLFGRPCPEGRTHAGSLLSRLPRGEDRPGKRSGSEDTVKDYIAYCGLDCETCEARLAAVKDAGELRRKVAALWSELNGAVITPDMINCTGCRTEGAKTPYCDSLCPIRRCAMSRNEETCGSCAEMETCEKLAMITGNNPDALKNLRS